MLLKQLNCGYCSFNNCFTFIIKEILLEDDLLDLNEVSKKLIELEDRSRRSKLRFDGLT